MERLEKLQALLQNNPNDTFVQHAMGMEYVKAGDDGAAQNILEKLLAAHPDYVGSYYHLAKIFERQNDEQNAAKWYMAGMAAAQQAGDVHAYGELKSAYEYLIF